jgi:hypothetical protein
MLQNFQFCLRTNLEGHSAIKAAAIHTSFLFSGRLGNQMSSYASLYAFEKVYGLRAYITRAQKTLFKNFFNFESLKKISVLEDEYASYKKLKWIAPFP